jgi:hypothetical protein
MREGNRVIRTIFFAAASVWFLWYLVNLLWVAKIKGYVMARTRPFQDRVETPQTRQDNPGKYWANVVVAIVLLPLAAGAVWLGLSTLWATLQIRGK